MKSLVIASPVSVALAVVAAGANLLTVPLPELAT